MNGRPAALVWVHGEDGAGGPELRAALVRRALAWAAATGDPWLAHAPGDDVASLAGPGVRTLAVESPEGPGLAAATAEVFERHGGPLLVVAFDHPRLSSVHADAALGDLSAGCDLVFGPALDGGWYLLGLAAAQPGLFAVDPGAWSSPEVMSRTLAVAHEAGLAVGLLRAEQPLRTTADVRAARLDPLFPPEIAALLA